MACSTRVLCGSSYFFGHRDPRAVPCDNRAVLTLRRARRPLAIVCIAVVALAVFAPGVAVLDAIAPPPLDFVLLPQIEPLAVVASVPVAAEQTDALRAALPERAPPRT